jgi:protein involved in polysaccharide export with SLBB domain
VLLLAQVSPPATTPAESQVLVGVESPVISENYVLMPGDRLYVTVTGGVTYTYEGWVTYDGKLPLSLPEVGIVDALPVSGLTMQRAEDSLTIAMLRYYKQVRVRLALTGMRSGIVFLAGEVMNPGAYAASPVERVSQVIARAGGFAPLGSRSSIRLIRAKGPATTVDIAAFEESGSLDANPFVQSGDLIHVPRVEALVTVKGAVFGRGDYRLRVSTTTTEKERVSEGIYEIVPGDRVADVLRKAGGSTPWADLSNAYIERLVIGGGSRRGKLAVDLRRVIFEGDSTGNYEMMNSDVLVVPPINTLVYVEGEVTTPNAYAFTPNQRFQDYLGMAGGPTNYANMGRAYIQRAARRIGARDNPVVEPGDIVMVPRMTIKWWQDYVSIISAIGIPVASILLTVALANP